ncbi:MAG TPA: RNA polymerase sigma factor [Cyclobacteriaceae bacterium]|nr:RNA polymerase sigma factor [Cyclobacteriaceae bacterium]
MSDESLMDAVKAGELQKVALLFDRYHKRIFNYLARMCSDREVAEDLTQNVFLRLMRYRHSYRSELRFQSWIYQVARNVFADHYRSTKIKKSAHMVLEQIENTAEDKDEFLQEEREAILHKSLALLKDDDRELLVLTKFQHMKYEEVAEVLDTSVSNVKVKVHRAIQKLREIYFELEKI